MTLVLLPDTPPWWVEDFPSHERPEEANIQDGLLIYVYKSASSLFIGPTVSDY